LAPIIPHSRPTLSDDDAERVARVVRGGQIAQGPEVAALEQELARFLGVAAAAAVSSGSAALELALRAVDVGPGDEVIIPTYVCDALYHAVTRCGATPVLADADPETLGLSAADAARRRTPRTRAIIAVHPFGLAVDLADLQRLGVALVEDCAQTLGATVGGRPVGARGVLAVCSFYATKLLTTGEGGAVAGSADLVGRVRDMRDYDGRTGLAPRFNYKMTDVQAALGRGQLPRLGTFIARRRVLAARYRAALARAPRCRVPADAADRHVYHRFVVAVDTPLDPVLAHLERRGVAARRPVFRPIHRALGLSGYPNAERLWTECLSIPCYPLLTDGEADTVTAALAEALA
jgi:dTDP-4-amino-4,6-dideoxygalactose transaminase